VIYKVYILNPKSKTLIPNAYNFSGYSIKPKTQTLKLPIPPARSHFPAIVAHPHQRHGARQQAKCHGGANCGGDRAEAKHPEQAAGASEHHAQVRAHNQGLALTPRQSLVGC